MPIYNFRCQGCAAEVELLLSLDDDTPPVCPDCGSTRLTRLVSRPAPPGKTAGHIASARRQAAKEGHFSHYSKAERAKLKP